MQEEEKAFKEKITLQYVPHQLHSQLKHMLGLCTLLSTLCVASCVYLNRLLLLENRREVGQDEADILLLGALFSDQQHVGQHEGNHVQVDKLRGQCRQDSIHHHSLGDRKKQDVL